MEIRAATSADGQMLEALWRSFEEEVPPPPHADHDPGVELEEIRAIVASGLAFLAEEDGRPLGFALARRASARRGRLTDLYVVPDARRGGVAAALVHAVVEHVRSGGRGAPRSRRRRLEHGRARRLSPVGFRGGHGGAHRTDRSVARASRARSPCRVVCLTARPDGRGLGCGAGGSRVRPPHPITWDAGRRPAQRLGDGLRRGRGQRPHFARPLRAGDLVPHGRGGRDTLARGGACRANDRARPRRDRRRVSLRPGVLRADPAR